MASPDEVRPIEPETDAEERVAVLAELAASASAPADAGPVQPMSASHERPELPD